MARRSNEPAVADTSYVALLEEVKQRVVNAQLRAHALVTTELLSLYWSIGDALNDEHRRQGWGAGVVEKLARDLRREFPAMTGLSVRNLTYMRTFASAWPRGAIHATAVAQLPWGHVTLLLDRLSTADEREWYAAHAVHYGWSRAVLLNQIKSDLRQRAGSAPTNFSARLSEPGSDLAAQIVKDPYNFSFLALQHRVDERELEQRLISQIQDFLLELGDGFALYGRQHRFSLGSQDFVIDLVFFHVTQARFVIVELKVGAFAPEHVGQLQFYVEWAERHLKRPGHEPTVGILLCAERDDLIVRYALAAASSPIAVATFTFENLPAKTRRELPSSSQLQSALESREQGPITSKRPRK